MSLAYAILAALNERECSGYDLAKYFEESIGYFWSATHQQIYRELALLEEKGWVKGKTIEQEDRPNKKLFALTTLGQDQMAEWMARPSRLSKHKEEILVKLFAGELVSPDVLIVELERLRQVHHQQLQTYQEIERQYFPSPKVLPYAAKCQYLTLRQGISHELNWVRWCDEAIAMLKEDRTESRSSQA